MEKNNIDLIAEREVITTQVLCDIAQIAIPEMDDCGDVIELCRAIVTIYDKTVNG